MRSRYTAFAVGNRSHLQRTWHPDTCPDPLRIDRQQRWLGLEILDVVAGTALDSKGQVEFRARYQTPDGSGALHERSAFVRVDGRWVYIEPVTQDAQES